MKHDKEKVSSILKKYDKGISLDIGCGKMKQQGFVGLDIRPLPGVDIVQDVEKFPWPLPDECASFAMTSHLLEHINPVGGTFIRFMNEVWRVMKPGGKFINSLPYAGSAGFWQDPTHCNGCTERTWPYFDPLHYQAGNGLYSIYEPAPWKVVDCFVSPIGNMEVTFEKRLDDVSYHSDRKLHFFKGAKLTELF